MKIPSLSIANEFILEGGRLNPGTWVDHSRNVARAAEIIASHIKELDPNAAYILGLLHDIGRREGVTFTRHTLDGYNFLLKKGFPDAARICMTHMHSSKDEWDCTEAEFSFVTEFFNDIEFNEYDKLIQLCDALALPSGFCLLEKRFVEALIRHKSRVHNIIDYVMENWEKLFIIKEYFDNKSSCSIYSLLPGIIENTFEMNI